MSQEEIYSNSITLTLAGAETTASALSAIIFMLASYPEVKAKLVKELRETFESEAEIDMRSTLQLRYLAAVIDETLRFHPPGPNALWRKTPPEGNRILGDFVPGNVSLKRRTRYKRGYTDGLVDHCRHPTSRHVSQRGAFQTRRRIHPRAMARRQQELRIFHRQTRCILPVLIRPSQLHRDKVSTNNR